MKYLDPTKFAPVIEAIIEPGVMTAARGPLPPNVHVVYALREALGILNLYTKRDLKTLPPDPKPLLKREPRKGPLAVDGKPMERWTDANSSVRSKLKWQLITRFAPRTIEDRPIQDEIEREIRAMDHELIHPLCKQMGWFDLAGGCDLLIIVLMYQVGDHPSGLGQLLFRIYRAGGLVCGWAGEFPQGSPIVYWPHEAPVTFSEA